MNVSHVELRSSLREVGLGLRRPEELALRWKDRRTAAAAAPSPVLFPVLIANAVVGIAVYGMIVHLHQGPVAMIEGAVFAPLAAGTSWALALPALYILGAALGSRLDFSTTLLAASLTVSFGSLALLASVPVGWFFTLALPWTPLRLAVHGVVFTGVGICMADVFLRVMKALEPERGQGLACVWLGLVGLIGAELFTLLGVFEL